MAHYVLASGSPRRKELLGQLGLDFEISSAHGEELITKSEPSDIVLELSLQKAKEVAQRYAGKEVVVIGADTIVAYDGAIMGKPRDEAHAREMLTALQGNTHQVYTGVALITLSGAGQQVQQFYEKTDVMMYPMTQDEIARYVATGEPMDKAGAYAIQGGCAPFIRGICGDYNNVVGLPIARLYQELLKKGQE